MIQAQENPELLWNNILENKQELQNGLGNQGRLLFLSKRRNYNEASLSVHVAESNILGNFVAQHVAKIKEATGMWVTSMLSPVFFPLPKDTKQMKRYVLALKIFPNRLSGVYEKLSIPNHPEWIKQSYLAYTLHLFNDSIQLSLLSERPDAELRNYISTAIDKIPGILKSTVFEIEKTHPFISYEEWQDYASQHPTVVEWNGKNMIAQYQ
jgi:hypothetical protein